MTKKFFQLIIQYIYGFLFSELQRKNILVKTGVYNSYNYGTMELWNYVVIRTSGPEGSSCVGPGAPFMAISPYVHVGLDNEKWVGY